MYGYIAATFIAKAYEKASRTDIGKFIDALEGMSVDSPVGKLTVRAYDHQVMFAKKIAGL